MTKLHHHLQRHLYLQPHKHTGKLLHHRHTSYRGLIVVFGLAAASILGMHQMAKATAESFVNVYATMSVTMPQQPASISLPGNGTTVTTAQTAVAGSCPLATPQVAIALVVDGAESGSSVCGSNNNFVISTTLTPGAHHLVARVYTINNDRGKDSQPVAVTSRSAGVTASLTPLFIVADQPVTYLGSDPNTVWSGKVLGDLTAARALVDWGDGARSTYRVSAGHLSYSHRFASPSSHNVRITVVNAAGTTQSQQFAFAAYRKAPAPLAAGATSSRSAGNSTLFGLYGLFLTALSLCGILSILEHKKQPEAALEHARTN